MAIRGVARGLKKAASKAKPKRKTTEQKSKESFAKLPKSQQAALKRKAAANVKRNLERQSKPKLNADQKEDIRLMKSWYKHGLIDSLPDFSKMDFSKMGKNVGIMGLIRMAEAAPKSKSSPKPKPKTTAKPKTAMKGGPRPAPKKKPMATKPPPVALGLAKGGPDRKAREAKVTELYKVQATIREKAKKAGMSVKRFRQLHPNDPSVKRVYKLRPTIKYEDDVRIYKQSKKK